MSTPLAHLGGHLDQDRVLHVRRDDIGAAEVLVGPAQQILGGGVRQIGGAARLFPQIGLCAQCVHLKSALSARMAHWAKRSPSSLFHELAHKPLDVVAELGGQHLVLAQFAAEPAVEAQAAAQVNLESPPRVRHRRPPSGP